MEDTKRPADMNELQAWKLMMDSMVKFIQASTRLMNTFNDKANSQLSLIEPADGGTSFRTLLAPAFSALENYQSKVMVSNSSRPGSAPQPVTQVQLLRNTDIECKEIEFQQTIKDVENIDLPVIDFNEDHENNDLKTDVDNIDINGNPIYVNNSPIEDDINLPNEDEIPIPNGATTDGTSITSCCPADSFLKQIESEHECDAAETEKMEVTKLMTQKLEQAQKEIDDLKKELLKLQSAKNNKVSALYKEIMKESAIDKTLKSSYSTKIDSRHDDDSTLVSNRRIHPFESTPRQLSPVDCCKHRPLASSSVYHSDYLIGSQSGPANWQPSVAQRRNIPHRVKPRLANDMVCVRRSRPQRRFIQTSSGYEQPPMEIYNPMAYQTYQKQIYPIYTRTESPGTECIYSSPRPVTERTYNYQQGNINRSSCAESELDYICGDHSWQPVYQSYERTDDCSYPKDDNYLSVSDDASVEEYLCDNELI